MFFPIFVSSRCETLTPGERQKYLESEYKISCRRFHDSWDRTLYDKYLDKSIDDEIDGNTKLARWHGLLSDFAFFFALAYRVIATIVLAMFPVVGCFWVAMHATFKYAYLAIPTSISFLFLIFGFWKFATIPLVLKVWFPKRNRGNMARNKLADIEASQEAGS